MLRRLLDETTFNREWESGGKMTLDEGLALAPPGRGPSTVTGRHTLARPRLIEAAG